MTENHAQWWIHIHVTYIRFRKRIETAGFAGIFCVAFRIL